MSFIMLLPCVAFAGSEMKTVKRIGIYMNRKQKFRIAQKF